LHAPSASITSKGGYVKNKVTLLLLFTAMLGALTISGRKMSAEDPKTINIEAKKFSYDPSSIILKKNQPVTLLVKSVDVPHGLRISEFNVNLKVGEGDMSQVTFTPDKTGDFKAHCSTFCGSGHGSMALTIHVVE